MKDLNKELLDQMYIDHEKKMLEIADFIRSNPKNEEYYDLATHYFLKENAWEILFPLPKENWGEMMLNLHKQYDPGMKWPNFSTWCYTSDILMPPSIPAGLLSIGYAFMEDGSVKKVSFYRSEWMVEYQIMPQGVVIDPLGEMHNIKPKYYVGHSVEIEDIERFRFMKDIRVLEGYVARKNKEAHEERLHDSYMSSYYLQMAYEPNYLPKRLQDFAKKNGLPFPEEQHSTF